MTSSIPEPTKTPKVTVNLTLTFDGIANMSLSDLATLNDKIALVFAEAKKLGAVEGTVQIGKQKFKVAG